MENLLKKNFQGEDSSFITLFLPGVPGGYKDRPLFEDLKAYHSDIYSLVYPGTYGKAGEFSIQSSIAAVKAALKSLRELNKPILIVAYSFSTMFLADCLEQGDDLLGVLFFSPITDLNKCIHEDFSQVLRELRFSEDQALRADLQSLDQFIKNYSEEEYCNSLKKLGDYGFPLVFMMGDEDKTVRTEYVYRLVDEVKIPQKIIYKIKGGEHKLDTLYAANYVKKVVLSLVLTNLIRKSVTHISGVFLWGSTMNYWLDSPVSDLDMILIGEGFSYKELAEINSLKSEYEQLSKIKIDFVYNSLKEIASEKIIRRNRGILFSYEIENDYFPLYKNFELPQISFESLKKDVLSMYYSSVYHARKTILNYDFQSENRRLNIKNFIYNCRNYLYLEGFQNPTLDDTLKFLNSRNEQAARALEKCIELKKVNYQGLEKDFDLNLLEILESLFSSKVKAGENEWYFEESRI
jgi:hypothetical protein